MAKYIVITVLFAVLGALAWVVPPHALGQVTDHHPEVTWQWLGDGLWNSMPKVSVPLIFALGLVYGLLCPRYFWLSFFVAWWVCPFNFVLDISQYPTSHNLFPFKFLFFAVISLPALVGGWIGRIIENKKSSKARPATPTNT